MRPPCRYRCLFLLFFLLAGPGPLSAQISLHYHPDSLSRRRDLPYTSQRVPDSLALRRELSGYLQLLYARGFLDASADTQQTAPQQYRVLVHTGRAYRPGDIRNGNLPPGTSLARSLDNRNWFGQNFAFPRLQQGMRQMLADFEEDGYPYASVYLDSIAITDNRFHAAVKCDMGPLVLYDSVQVKGSARIAPGYLYAYLGIRPGRPYNRARLEKADERLRDLPFVNVYAPAQVKLLDDKARVYLSLNRVNTSFFNGILGVQPGSGTGGKPVITGDIQLRLWNVLERGEQIFLEWRRIQSGTQSARVWLAYPYLFATPLGVWGKFDFFRRDSSFQNVEYGAGVDYLWYGTNKVRLGFSRAQSRLIDRTPYVDAKKLPENIDMDWDKFSLEGEWTRYDYRRNPLRGFSVQASLNAGVRRIRPISELPDSLYAGIPRRSLQLLASLRLEKYIRLARRLTLRCLSQSAYQYNPALFYNELLRIGGFATLRGFDEESIYTSGYSYASAELRFLYERNSNVFVFLNGGFVEQKLRSSYDGFWAYGFGAGVNFSTKIGVLNLTYALGSRDGAPIQFRNSKIHVGFAGYF